MQVMRGRAGGCWIDPSLSPPRLRALSDATVPAALMAALLTYLCLLTGCATSESAGETPGRCHRYLVIPPQHDDETASDFIATTWIATASRKLGSCDQIIRYPRGKRALLSFGMTHEDKVTRHQLGDEQIERLVERTNATHVVVIHYAQRWRANAPPGRFPAAAVGTGSPPAGDPTSDRDATAGFAVAGRGMGLFG